MHTAKSHRCCIEFIIAILRKEVVVLQIHGIEIASFSSHCGHRNDCWSHGIPFGMAVADHTKQQTSRDAHKELVETIMQFRWRDAIDVVKTCSYKFKVKNLNVSFLEMMDWPWVKNDWDIQWNYWTEKFDWVTKFCELTLTKNICLSRVFWISKENWIPFKDIRFRTWTFWIRCRCLVTRCAVCCSWTSKHDSTCNNNINNNTKIKKLNFATSFKHPSFDGLCN